MSVITDGSTITGDGGSSETALAITSVVDISALQSYGGLATVVFVSDPLRGGTFIYQPYPSYSATFGFGGSPGPNKITDSSGGFVANGFANGQTIIITYTLDNDGLHIISNVDSATQLTISDSGLTAEIVASTITIVTQSDDGTIFTATGKGTGVWMRQYNAADGLNVMWFGAMANANYNQTTDGVSTWYAHHSGGAYAVPANDDTTAIQSALTVAAANPLSVTKVVLPAGRYLHTTIYIPQGVLVTGTGAITESTALSATKLIMKQGGADSFRISGITNSSWYGMIRQICFYGEPLNSTGWAISIRDSSGNVAILADMTVFEYLQMRGYPSGGIEVPNSAVPLSISNIKGNFMNGPIIKIFRNTGTSGQSINLNNISGDHSVGGAIWLQGFDSQTNFVINNLKSEGGNNTAFAGQPNAQVNPIISVDNVNTLVTLINASHINTAVDPFNAGLHLKPGDMMSIETQLTTTGTATGGASNSITLQSNASNITDAYVGAEITITGGTGANQTKTITAYNSSTFVATVSPVFSTLPDATSTYSISLPTIDISIGSPAVITLSGVSEADQVINGDTLKFYTTGKLPWIIDGTTGLIDGIIAGQIYTVENAVYSATNNTTTFNLSSISAVGTATAGTSNTITLQNNASNITNAYVGSVITITSGTGVGQTGTINGYDPSTFTATISGTFSLMPDSTSTYLIVLTANTTGCSQSGAVSVYKQVTYPTSAKVPQITWIGNTMRIRPTDTGVNPLMISKSAIPYTSANGNYNITQQNVGYTVLGLGIGTAQNIANPSSVVIGGNVTAPAWTTTGRGIRVLPANYTDSTTAAGNTVAGVTAIHSLSVPTLIAANATPASPVNYGNAATLFLAGPPAPGANTVISNGGYAFYIAAGLTRLSGNTGIGLSPASTSLLSIGAATSANSTLNIKSSASVSPSSPMDGDIWYDGTHLYMYNNSTSIDLLAGQGNAIKEVAEQTYSGTITWLGTTAPSGTTTHRYWWSKVGHTVTLNIILNYSIVGVGLTSVDITLPSDLPTPVPPTGLTSANNVLCTGSGVLQNISSLNGGSGRSAIVANSANTGYVIRVTNGSAVSASAAYATIIYWA